jgi:hypothetical protein
MLSLKELLELEEKRKKSFLIFLNWKTPIGLARRTWPTNAH